MSQRVLREGRVFAGLCVALSASVLVPILLAERPCDDDLVRSVLGSYGWVDNGRYLSNLLMRMLELGASRASDIAPVPQILAVLALSYAGVLLARRFAIASVPLAILVTLPLGTQPFFLQNLSYRFDSVTMAAALLCSVSAVTFSHRSWRNWICGSVALLASFNLYQPAFNVFLVLAVFELAFEIARESSRRTLVRLAGSRISQAIVAAIVYKWLFTIGIKDWVAARGETIHSLDALPVVATNLLGFLRYLRDALGERLTGIFLVLILGAMLPMTALAIHRLWRLREMSIPDAMLRSVFLLAWPVLGLLASIGPMLLLVQPVFAPRVFPALGALMAASLISAAHAGQRVTRLRRLPYVAAGTCFVVSAITAGAYSSASSEQRQFEDRIVSTMQDDLAQLKSSSPLANYVVVGGAGYAPAALHTMTQFPIIGRLVEPYLVQDNFVTKTYLMHFRQPLSLIDTAQLGGPQRHAVLDACASPAVVARSTFRIRIVDEVAVVDFREPERCTN